MDKTEYHAGIKFFVKEGLTSDAIHSTFINVYGDSSASFSTIKKWAAEFKRGRTTLKVINMKDIQKVQQHQKSLNKCTIRYWMTSG
jgi:L-ribulose-5-phosphate 3-epimerase UlaE